MAIERILGTDTRKAAFEKTDRNFVALDADIGDKSTLTTDVKTNLVNAINEHETQINNLNANVVAHKAINAIDAHSTIPACRAYNIASQSIASSSWTNLNFDITDFDTNSIHTDADKTKFICKNAGKYSLSAMAKFAMNTSYGRCLDIMVNSVAISSNWAKASDSIIAETALNAATSAIQLSTNDVITVRALQDSVSALNVTTCNFSMVKVG